MEYHYTAIVLGKRDRADVDRLYTLYTKESGKIHALAKGVRKMEAKLAGHLEDFMLSTITVVRTRGTGKITASVVEESFPHLRTNVDGLRTTYRALRLFHRLVGLEEKDQRLFRLLHEFLTAMDVLAKTQMHSQRMTFLSCIFLFKMFPLLGYDISFAVCVQCRRKLDAQGNAFHIQRGGILCARCALAGMNGNISISANVIKALRLMRTNAIASLAKVRMPEADGKTLCALAEQFAYSILA